MQERLNKYLARSGIASRRKADSLIYQGHVEVEGVIITDLGVKIDPDIDVVKVDGSVVKPPLALAYIMLNKPPGFISSVSSKQGRTVIDLVDVRIKVFPVGRLDKDSRGLILLTNDGELAYKITHPKFGLPKKYVVKVKGKLNAKQIKLLTEGVTFEEGLAKVANIEKLDEDTEGQTYSIVLKQGFKRQIRRMVAEADSKVLDLKRVAIGPLQLDNLPEGKSRPLSDTELKKLKDI